MISPGIKSIYRMDMRIINVPSDFVGAPLNRICVEISINSFYHLSVHCYAAGDT